MDKLITLVQGLMAKKFFGELVIKFQNGKIIFIQKTESIKV